MDYDTPDDEPLKPQYVVEQFSEMTPDDTIVCSGVGQHQMWASQFGSTPSPGRGCRPTVSGRWGTACQPPSVPNSPRRTGGRLLRRRRLVPMTVPGLSVAVREQPNRLRRPEHEAVGMVRQWQDGFYEGRRMASEYPWIPSSTSSPRPWRARVHARILRHVEETIQVAATRRADASTNIDPGENVFPLVPCGGDNGQFALNEDHLDMI